MAQASLRLGRALTSQTVRRNFCVSSAISGKHVNYSVQDGVAVLRCFAFIWKLKILTLICLDLILPIPKSTHLAWSLARI